MSSMTHLGKAAQRSRHLLPLVVIALIGCLGGCAYGSDDVSRPSASSPTTEVSAIPPFPESGDIDAGTYLVTDFTVPFEITVPDGWSTTEGDGLGKDDPGHPGEGSVDLTFWADYYVPTDACACADCRFMKMNTLEKLHDALLHLEPEIILPEEIRRRAEVPLRRMLEWSA